MNKLNQKKVALVTGGTGGIGSAITKKLVKKNYHVLVTHRNKPNDFLSSWLDSNMLSPEEITFVDFDITHNNNTLSNLLTKFEIDVLVNNAGITKDAKFLKMSFEDWNAVIQTNLIALFNTTQLVAEQMVSRKKGSIINISSINGLKGQYGQTNYSASKAGVIGFTKALAQELASSGVLVNAIAPGYTLTPMVKKLPEKIINRISEDISTGQLADPDEVAETVLFLCRGIPSITGETISVNGGHYMN